MRKRYLVPLVIILIAAVLVTVLASRSDTERRTYFVAPGGSNNAPGTFERPFGTIEFALRRLRAGDTLYVRGGEYHEQIRNPHVREARRTERITVSAWPRERPVIVGLLWMRNADYWTIQGINVTWDPRNMDASEHMVKFSGGRNWVYTNAEVWGARSFAGILVTGRASNWIMSWLYVHDTRAANGFNQDQLIYVSEASNGVIEHCLLVNSTNGRGVKLGRPKPGLGLPEQIIVRFNTFVANSGGAVGSSYDTRNNEIHDNVMIGNGSGPNITEFDLTYDSQTLVRDNVGWSSSGVVGPSNGYMSRDNVRIDPVLDRAFRPTNPRLLSEDGAPTVGHLAEFSEGGPPVTLNWSPE